MEDFGIVLALAYQQFVAELRAHLAEQGFTDLGTSDGYIFRLLADRPATISEIATRLTISKQGAGQLIEDMEARAYVERTVDPDDARARPVCLSKKGKRALAAARRFHARYEASLVEAHGARSVTQLRTILVAMIGDGAGPPVVRPG